MKVEDNATRVLEIQNTLIGQNVPSLFEAGRAFVFEGDLHKITSRFVVNCHIFLFNDIMLYSHQKVLSWWIHKGTLHLGNCWTRPLNDSPRYKNLFQIVGPAKTWTFSCKTREERDLWLKNLDKVIGLLVESNPEYLKQREKVNVKVRGGIFKTSSNKNKEEFDPESLLNNSDVTTTTTSTTITTSSSSSSSSLSSITSTKSSSSSSISTSIIISGGSPNKSHTKEDDVKQSLLSNSGRDEEEEEEGNYNGYNSINGNGNVVRGSSSSIVGFVKDMFSCCMIL